MSLKWRLTLWYALFTVALAVASILCLNALGTKQTRKSLSEQVIRLAELASRELEFEDGQLELDDDVSPVENGIFLSVYTQAGERLLGTVPPGFPEGLSFSGGALEEQTDQGVTYYYYDTASAVQQYGSIVIRAAASLTEAESSMANVHRLALFALPILTLISAVGGYLVARQSLRPLHTIATTAKRIGESADLTARIALGDGRDEVHTLATAFDGMCDRLEAAFEKEKRFTADASHELRTPTAVILAQSEYALSHPEEAEMALNTIHKQARKMSALISQLLVIARGERRDAMQVDETLNLSELVEVVALEQAELAERKHITFHIDVMPNCLMRGDESQLMRLWMNLMENAVRYGRDGGNVWVGLTKLRNEIRVTVRDDGIGMEPEVLKRIFERFYQADSSRNGEGAGLGLPMARSIATRHGGEIVVESKPGAGSTFTVIFPV